MMKNRDEQNCHGWQGNVGVGQENGEAVLLSSKARLVYFGIVDKVWTENAQAK